MSINLIPTTELIKRLPRRKITISGRRMTYKQWWNSTTDKNIRYWIRCHALRLLGY